MCLCQSVCQLPCRCVGEHGTQGKRQTEAILHSLRTLKSQLPHERTSSKPDLLAPHCPFHPLLQTKNVFVYYTMCSLTIEYVLLL